MEKIEHKILKLLVGLLGAGMGVVILACAAGLFIMRNTGIQATEQISRQFVEQCTDLLAEEMSSQARKYALSCSQTISSRLQQTELSMETVAGGIRDIYENPGRYGEVAYNRAGETKGRGKKMHWLLPEKLKFEGEIKEEIYRLGNILPYFQSLSENNRQVLRIYYTSETGANIGYDADYAKKPPVFEGRTRDWYVQAAKTETLIISKAYADAFAEKLVVTFSLPCIDSSGKLLGVLALDLLIDDVEDMIDEIHLEFGGYAMLISDWGEMVAAPGMTDGNAGDLELFLGSGSQKILGSLRDKPNADTSQIFNSKIQGKEKYVMYAAMQITDWNIFIVLDRQEFEQAASSGGKELEKTAQKAEEKLSGQIMVICALWAVVVALLLSAVAAAAQKTAGKISGPIAELTRDVKRIDGKSLDYISHIETHDEIEELSRAFASMTQSLKTYISNLAGLTAEKERLATELHVATQIQVSMLPCIFPAFPEREELDIFAFMNPAREVGGDFYDFFLIDNNRLCIIIADVSGKGIPAALFMVVAKTLIKDHMSSGRGMEEAFEKVNRQLCQNNEAGMFVTVFAGCLELESGKFTYINAGHNPPVLIAGTDISGKGTDKIITWLDGPADFVLAAMEGTKYRAKELFLQPRDMLFTYTDGVTEALNEEGELYGNQRLWGAVLKSRSHKAQGLIKDMAAELDAYIGSADQADDITMLALKYQPDEKSRNTLYLKADVQYLPWVREFLDRKISYRLPRGTAYAEKIHREVQMAAEEIFTNIAQYAYKNLPGDVAIRLACTEKEVKVTFIDSGFPYNPLWHPLPDIQLTAGERPIGGLGIYIVRQSMDEVHYLFKEKQNRLTIIKKFSDGSCTGASQAARGEILSGPTT